MKKLYPIILAAVLFVCACSSNKGGSSSNDSLQGVYSIDISNAGSIFESEFKAQEIPSTMISTILSQLDLTVEFADKKAKLDAGTTVSMLLKTVTNGKYTLPVTMEYKIENDSVIYLKQEGEDFKQAGIIKKDGDTYDKVLFKPKYKQTEVTISLQRN
ncbi:MAG: hypothetical protein IKS00_00780 [Bacteroidales bacterium]|nr:hypothetical protein [Bacteroidales bacterium]